ADRAQQDEVAAFIGEFRVAEFDGLLVQLGVAELAKTILLGLDRRQELGIGPQVHRSGLAQEAADAFRHSSEHHARVTPDTTLSFLCAHTRFPGGRPRAPAGARVTGRCGYPRADGPPWPWRA